MKNFALIIAVVIAVSCLTVSPANADGKTLIAYFSWSGNTENVAKNIAEATGFELFEIKTAKAYSEDYDAVLDLAKKEQNRNARPELATHIQDMEQYDTLFLGYPCWWGTLPMPVFTFLEEYDFSGKRIIPFVTHGGSSFGRSLSDMKRLVPNAKIESNGLSIRGSSASASKSQVTRWLERIGFTTQK